MLQHVIDIYTIISFRNKPITEHVGGVRFPWHIKTLYYFQKTTSADINISNVKPVRLGENIKLN